MRYWWLAACLPLVFAACSRRAAPAPGGGASAQPASAAPRKAGAQPPPRAQSRPALPPVTAEQAMLAQPAAGLLPEDFEIGPLADRLGGSRTERLARATAARFLSGLAAGKAPDAEILPERREELARSLQYYLDRRLLPTRYRLGPFLELEDGSLRCRVRLLGGGTAGSMPGSAPASASGELYLSRAEETWYVADAQVGLVSLGTPATPRREKFVPSEVR